GQGRPDADAWPVWLRRPTLAALAAVLVSSYLLTWFAAACAFTLRRTQFVVLAGLLVLITMVLGTAFWYELRQAEIDRRMPLVVLANNTPFQRANAVSSPQPPPLPVLPRGMEVRQLHRRGDWLQIRLSSGEVGWIHASNALVVMP